MRSSMEYQMTEPGKSRSRLTASQYSPIGSSGKLNLLLQRSLRYSYRQRCCGCCPTVLCELLFPLLLIALLALMRYGTNEFVRKLNENPDSVPMNRNLPSCSQQRNISSSFSADVMSKCFRFPPSYKRTGPFSAGFYIISNRTNLVFQPETNETKKLVLQAQKRLNDMKCTNTKVWSKNADDKNDTTLLQNESENTVIIDFDSAANLHNVRKLSYDIIVRAPNTAIKNDPVDFSFISFLHPTFLVDRWNVTDSNAYEGSDFPEFSNVKMFIDSLLINYQTNRTIEYDIERKPMICTPYRRDTIFESGTIVVTLVLIFVDFVFLIPYLILLISLIREKNAKVKEILKVLGIEPILNNFAHAIRTLIIVCFLTILLCAIYKTRLKPDAFFNTVNFGTLFLGYLIFAIQLISFCIMNAQLFDKNVRAILGTFFFYLLSLIIYPYTLLWPVAIQYVLIFFSPYIAAHSLFQQSILHDLAIKDVAYFRTIYRYVPMFFLTLIVMILSSVFYWLLSWYLEKVFPGEYGVALDWNFLFKRKYWRSEKTIQHSQSFSNPSRSYAKNKGSVGAPIVRVDRLVKKFGPDKIAVNNVTFDLYENQITSLLGPNGSGKTTIFNCLIGMYKQTSGSIVVESEDGLDFDTRTNMDMLRKSMGYCPQHDILFDLLTIKEQIEFYATARGFGRDKAQIAHEMLDLVNLRNSKDLYCNSLSGGMKRRLSLACAFVGDTKIILLDEPSSGLDPSNRRLLWDWLRSMKEGKTLLLTTHFMEESDALSDRIMIIANGNIKADGTSAKLKEKYGSGYKLVVNKHKGIRTQDITKELTPFLPQIKVENDLFDGDIVFRTNQPPNESFVQALRQLENMKRSKQIISYGVQNSTMDDVFLKITRDTNGSNESEATDRDIIDKQCRQVFNNRHFFTGIAYYLSQYHGLLRKTLLVRYRRWALTLIVLLIPIVYHILSNLISRSQNKAGIFDMKFNDLNPQTVLYRTDPSIEKYFRASVDGAKLEQHSETLSDMNEKILQRRMNRPYTYTDVYLGFNIPKPAGDQYKIEALSSSLISGYEVVSVGSNTIYKYLSNDTSASIETNLIYKTTGNFTARPSVGAILNLLSMASCFLKLLPTSIMLDVFIFYILFFYTTVFLISERKDSFLSLLNISGLHPANYWLFSYLFDIILSVVWFCYLLAIYCIVELAFNGLPEKKSDLETLFSFEFATPWDLRVQFYPLTILIILPTLPFTYLLTKVFTSDILGGITILFILIILHFVSIIVPVVIMIINSTVIQDLLYWLFNVISPSINAQVIITYILARKSSFCKFIVESLGSADGSDSSFFKPVGDDTITWNIVILVLHTVLLLLILIIIDSGLIHFSFSCFYKSTFNENNLDDDVLAERRRILGLQNDDHETDHLVVNDLVKYYPMRKVRAVNHLTFGAKRGEAFGLLGYNGAGKTTTFRIIVGDLIATQGSAHIDGQDARSRLRSTRRLGYCPQQDCSMDFLTVQDSLYLLARIRGVKTSHIKSMVETIGTLFLLDPFLNNYIHQLSGGTKRRLHAAIALIGPPSVAILDEPTTGVDPNARQQMQDIFLNAVKAKLTIILTSHSMDECERVCNRLGIMVEGQLACLGAIQHLKSKFGQGYTVDIKVQSSGDYNDDNAIGNIHSFLAAQGRYRVEVKETTHSTGLFQIEHSTPAELFQLLEENKRQLHIETYTISQTTLEQIFLSFGKQIQTSVL